MTFLNPFLLAGLGAIAVPIVIHLLNRHRVHRVVWAAMRFLRTSIERNQRRMRIEDWLLLALRCLLLILLALALARPTFRSNAAVALGRAPVTGVLILDNSASMGATDGVQSRFARAGKIAGSILDSLPAGSSLAVLLASDTVRGLIPEPTHDLNLARKVIADAPLFDRATNLLPPLRQAVDTLRRRAGARKEIFLITDGQAGGWEALPEALKLLEDVKKEVHLNLVLIADDEQRNLGVSDLRMASSLTPVDQPLRFEVQVTNFGHEDARAVPVRLQVDAEPATDQAVIDHLPAGAVKSVPLFAKLRTEGFHAVTASIAEDRLAADDRRTLAVVATRKLRMLLVDGRPSRDPRESETFFLRNALLPVDPAAARDYYLDATVIPSATLATTRVDDYEAVVLANVSDFSQATAAALEQYVRRGGGLIVFPGPAVNARFYNEELAGRYGLLPATLGTLLGEPDLDEEKAFHLQAKDYEHPITALWNDPAAGTLASARFFRAFTLQPAKDALVVARFAGGSPAIVDRTLGQGRVVLFASTASTTWNDLPVRPAFVPLLYRTLGALLQQRDEAVNVPVGRKFVYRTSEEALGKDVLIVPQSVGEKARQFRRVELVNGRPLLESDETDYAGAYDVTIQSEPPVKLKFAAQADPRESRLDLLSEGQLAQMSNVANLVRWQPDFKWTGAREQARSGRELWRALAFVALLLAAAETVLGQKFSESK